MARFPFWSWRKRAISESKPGRHTRPTIERLEPRCLLDAGSLVISEFMAAGGSTLADADGQFHDWIEIYNPGPTATDLDGWYLTDDQGDLDKWRLPEQTLAPGGFLVVFASGKDRAETGSELHTNFRLDAGGEYLALSVRDAVEPDRTTVVSQFAPEFPKQYEGVSYGSAQDVTVTSFISPDTPAKVLIPTQTSPVAAWRNGEPFNDSPWLDATAAIGYDTEGSTSTENIASQGTPTQSTQYSGSFPASAAIDGNYDTFSHTENQPDSYWRLELPETTHLGSVVLFNRISCCAERLSNFRLSVLDESMTEVFGEDYFTPDQGGGNPGLGESFAVELPPGTIGKFVQVQLIGYNNDNNGYFSLAEVEVYETDGYHGLFDTDLLADMQGVNTSAYLRIPFTVDDPAVLDMLTLSMQYDDGFVAYLNGLEVARRNTPATLAWNSAATADRPDADAATVERINLSEHLDALRTGENLLAIHGLNNSAGDSDFLIVAELEGLTVEPLAARYFIEPTPGEVNSEGIVGFVADTRFSHDRGFYDEPFEVAITTNTPEATIRYTTDGSPPTATHGSEYTGPLSIDTTTTLRAAAFKPGYEPTNVDTQSYIFLNDVIRQPAAVAGMPTVWDGIAQNPIPADYEMDPQVVNSPRYSDEIIEGLKSIPTISIVMDPADLFGSERGIYINSGQRGRAWEHPTSVEIIEPDGSTFQVDSGIRIHGYSWRYHSNSPKHSFRLEFRDEYGPVKLEYPLFPDAPVERFDSIVLRAQGGRAWAGTQRPSESQYLRDTFARDTSRDMGAVDSHATLVHLYLNGLYWGLYNPVERPDAQMGEEYFGGSDEDYDALNRRTTTNEAIDGDLVRYYEMLALADQMLAEAAAGQDTSATYAAIDKYLDIDDMIDFFLVHQYTTNRDGPETFSSNNQRAIGSRVGDADFRFFSWDMEYSIWNATDNININVNVPTSISHVFTALRKNPEFRLRYADHVQQHMFNGGALTPQAAADRWEVRAESIYTAIIGESARWGDAKRSTPYTRDVEWQAERNRLLTQYFPQRTGILLGQLRTAGLYPAVAAPSFGQHGGDVPRGYTLQMSVPAGTVYYTLDGSDPRLPGGDVSPTAFAWEEGPSAASFISPGATWKYLDDGSDQGTDWYATDFDDGSWANGPAQLGYGEGDEATVVSYGADRSNRHITTYLRRTFQVDNAAEIGDLMLELLRDDGAVVYLNGQEVLRSNMSDGPIDYQTTAAATVFGSDESKYFEDALDPSLLRDGTNVLAVELHQRSSGSGDLSFDLALRSTSIVNPSPAVLTDSALVKTRTLHDGQWSALNQAQFIVGQSAAAGNLIVSEVNYHPYNTTQAESDAGITNNDQFEFIELRNISDAVVDLTGAKFTDGIVFDFTGAAVTRLLPGESLVVVRDPAAFELRYGSQDAVAGFYAGGLNNGGEQIVLTDRQGEPIFDFAFNDSGRWSGRADGTGASLELIDLEALPQTEPERTDYLSDGANWRSSAEYGGSPGMDGTGPVQGMVVNEVLSHTELSDPDTIELYNQTDHPIDIGGWYLSDSNGNLQKYRIPAPMSVPAGGYVVFDESHFNPTPLDPGLNDFALNGAHGDDVWLMETDPDGKLTRFVDHAEFPAAPSGESFGRWSNSDGDAFFYPMIEPTIGGPNRGPRVGPVVISELMYNPTVPNAEADPNDFEYIEIHNPTLAAIDLTNWRIRKGIDFDFAAGSVLSAGETLLVVSFAITDAAKLAAMRDYYQLDPSVRIMGPYSGQLNDDGERVRLQRPDLPPDGEPTYIPHVIEDEVVYGDVDPWPTEPDGTGTSLGRLSLSAWGNDAANWNSATPTPGMVVIADDAYEPNDSLATASLPAGDWSDTPLSSIAGLGVQADADWYRIDVAGQQRHLTVDVTFTHALGNIDVELVDSSGSVHVASQTTTDNERIDVVLAHPGTWYLKVFGENTGSAYDLVYSADYLHPGDANLDGATDLSDFNIWNANKFVAGTDWSSGDFNGDGNTDLSDFNIWNAFKFTTAAAPDPSPPEVASHEPADLTTTIDDLAWLREWEYSRRSRQSSDVASPAVDAVDRLLATYWE